MDKLAYARASTSAKVGYLSWKEVFVSSDKGRREVHYILKRTDGSSDLAVVGKEKSLRHMSYNYAIQNPTLISIGAKSSLVKLKSRREVIDWLNSIISDACPDKSSYSLENSLDGGEDFKLCREDQKSNGHYTKEFVWLGSASTCRKRRRHYQSFCRNGAKISVHDFVFVLAEEDKRLVAYLEDMYEDSRGNKMVVVRWFHKFDEVGIVLPHIYNDTEIFFSHCHQDLSIECIDGLASVLSPHDFEKFLSGVHHPQLKPFVCRKLFENDNVKAFDISQVEGYWKQEIVRYMYNPAALSSDYGLKVAKISNDALEPRPRKRLCRLRDSDMCVNDAKNKKSNFVHCKSKDLIESEVGTEVCKLQGGSSVKEVIRESPPQCLTVGSEVEVLCQDSGIRGCWFRALTIKKHKDKVKVRYHDIQDAADEANKLEEWILASKVATPDQLGFHMCERTVVRPKPQFNKEVSWVLSIGTAVDAWWHDGWWEGIVVKKEPDDRIHVYFPGEKNTSVFGLSELRHSQEWLGNSWRHIKENADLASSISAGLKTEHVLVGKSAQADSRAPTMEKTGYSNSQLCSSTENPKKDLVGPPLQEYDILAQLKWNSSKKRRRSSGSSIKKVQPNATNVTRTTDAEGSRGYGPFFPPDSVKVDHENCKYMGDSLFCSTAAPPLTSLVMSR